MNTFNQNYFLIFMLFNDDEEGMDFYTRLKASSQKNNITITQLCTAINFNLATFKTLQQRNHLPNLDIAAKMANYLNVSLDWLAFGQINYQQDNHLTETQQLIIDAVMHLPSEKLESVAILVEGLLKAGQRSKKESIA